MPTRVLAKYNVIYQHTDTITNSVVSYHQSNTAIAVFYSVLSSLSGRCFPKTAHHSLSVIAVNARQDQISRQHRPSCKFLPS